MGNLAVLGVSWGPETEYVAIFCMDMFIVPLYTIRCQSGHWPCLPSGDFADGVTLFPSGTLCATYISSIICNSTLCYSELTGEHAGKSYMSLRLRFIVLKHTNVKLKKCRLCENLTFVLQNWVKTWPRIKNKPPIASTRREQSAVFRGWSCLYATLWYFMSTRVLY